MDEKTERPELGTTEAAVRSCVNLIALATHTDEEHLAYWLDLYYQTRVAHEKTAPTLDFSQLMNAQEPVLVKLDELEKQIETLNKRLSWLPPFQSDVEDGPPRASAPTEEDARATARVAPTEETVEAPQPAAPAAPLASSRGACLGFCRPFVRKRQLLHTHLCAAGSIRAVPA